ncbi:MAG: hypothetical protein KGJ58_01410 [Patescibacteria group bacterium]|nr:hypothetical protein [Patescibacteria group bacterium]
MLNSFRSNKSGDVINIAVIIIAIVAFGTMFYFLSNPFRNPAPNPLSREEIMRKQQVEELNKLREKASSSPATAGEIKKQADELNKLRKQKKAKPFSQDEIKKQLEELNKLNLGAQLPSR